jgi:hypothetical protein
MKWYRGAMLIAVASGAVLFSGTRASAEGGPCVFSSFPGWIELVGTTNGVPPDMAFTIEARDAANHAPIPYAVITIDLSACDDLVLCEDQLDEDVTVDCENRKLSKVADVNGIVLFHYVLGRSTGGAASSAPLSARIYANSCLITEINAMTFDLDGQGGIGANDLQKWFTDFGGNWMRSDYDGSGTVGSNDLSLWLSAWAGPGYYSESCSAACP